MARSARKSAVPAGSEEPVDAVLDADQARELTDQIRAASESLWDLVKTAYIGRAWCALGYESWDVYVQTEFQGSRISLPREERGEVVHSLRDAGLSIRAIAAAVNVGTGTVHRDLEPVVETAESDCGTEDLEIVEATVEDPPAPPTVTGRDGRNYKAKREPRAPKPKPAPPVNNTIDMLAVARPARAAATMFDHADNGIGYGNTEYGACVFVGMVQWYAAGSYDEVTPAQAIELAACLLAAAEAAEVQAREEVA